MTTIVSNNITMDFVMSTTTSGMENMTFADQNRTTMEETPKERWGFLILVILVFSSLVANTLIVVAVSSQSKLHRTIHYLLLSLATCNLIHTLIIMPVNLVKSIIGMFPFGSVWCRSWHAGRCILSTAAIIHLCLGISDCHISLLNPIRYHLRNNCTYTALNIILTWAFSITLAVPVIVLQEYSSEKNIPGCNEVFKSHVILTQSVLTFFIPALLVIVLAIWASVDHDRKRRLADKMNSDTSSFSTSMGDVSGYEQLDVMSLVLGGHLNGDNGSPPSASNEKGKLSPPTSREGLKETSPLRERDTCSQESSEDSEEQHKEHTLINDIPDVIQKATCEEVTATSSQIPKNEEMMPDFLANTWKCQEDKVEAQEDNTFHSHTQIEETSDEQDSVSMKLKSSEESDSPFATESEANLINEAKVSTSSGSELALVNDDGEEFPNHTKKLSGKTKAILNLPLTFGTTSTAVPESEMDGYDNEAFEDTPLADAIQVKKGRQLTRHSTWQKSRSMDHEPHYNDETSSPEQTPMRRASSLGNNHSSGKKTRTRSILRQHHGRRSTVRKNVKFATNLPERNTSISGINRKSSRAFRRRMTPHPRKKGELVESLGPSTSMEPSSSKENGSGSEGNGPEMERCNSIQSLSSMSSLHINGSSPLTAYLAWVHKEHSKRMVQRLYKQQEILRMLTLMFLSYAILCLPQWILLVTCAMSTNPTCKADTMATEVLPLTFDWMAMSTSLVSPIIVMVLNKDIRDCICKSYCTYK